MKQDLTYELLLALVRMQTMKVRGGYYGIRSTSGLEPMPIKCLEVSFFKNDSAKELLGILGWQRNIGIMKIFFTEGIGGSVDDDTNDYEKQKNIDEINNLYMFNKNPEIGISKNCSGERSIIIRMIYMIFGVNPYSNYYQGPMQGRTIRKTYAKIIFEANKLKNHYNNAINIRIFNKSKIPNNDRRDYHLFNIQQQQKIIKAAINIIESRFLLIAIKHYAAEDLPHPEAIKLMGREPSIKLDHVLNIWGGSIESYRNGVIKNNFPVPFEVTDHEDKRYWAVDPWDCVYWLESKNISCDLIGENNSSDKNSFIFEKIFQQMESGISIRKAKKLYEERISYL